MKYFILCLYLLACGAFLGFAHNHHHEKCGTKGTPSNSDVISAAFFPVALGFIATMDEDYYQPAECKRKDVKNENT